MRLRQVLVEQCRRLGVDIEASSAHIASMAEAARGSSNGAAGSSGGPPRRKPGWNLDISAIHARIKQVWRPLRLLLVSLLLVMQMAVSRVASAV